MPSTTAAVRLVPLGHTFTPEIPLGPAGNVPLTCYATASGKGKLHGAEDCGLLRSASSVRSAEIPLGEAVGRLCGTCRWPLPADSPLLKLLAAVIDIGSLKIWLDREPDSEEEKAEEADAALALATGDYPPSSTGEPSDETDGEAEEQEEDFDDEAWERYSRARETRRHHHEHWRYLYSVLLRSNTALQAFPVLRPWAEPLQVRLAEVIDEERRAFAALVQPVPLVEAAAVGLLPAPEFTPGPEFAGLGADAAKVMRRAWHAWERRASWSWSRLEDNGWAVSSVVDDAFGRRRKGRPEAEAAFEQLVADWISEARRQAALRSEAPRQLVAVKVPAAEKEPYEERAHDPLTAWEAAVIATYQVAVDWPAGTAALLVPHLIGEHLIAGASTAMPVTRLAVPDSALPVHALLRAWQPEDDEEE
ncbi:hypothetical protein ACFVXG_22225 [Kitasatospora sp. NPDC058162]|uniref:hypothetical protein n=1 Tax=Kitasatospora sp. NPDC058162 TaxID=3346362 RepID=UPI0036D7BDE2